jgi:hypothetical protein
MLCKHFRENESKRTWACKEPKGMIVSPTCIFYNKYISLSNRQTGRHPIGAQGSFLANVH